MKLNKDLILKRIVFLIIIASCIYYFNYKLNSNTSTLVQPDCNEATQYGTINSLLEGNYDGNFTISDIKQNGNIAIGTFDRLNGELVGLNDTIYRIDSNGEVEIISDNEKTPFAVIADFNPDTTLTVNHKITFDQLCEFLDSILPTKNIFYAIKISGDFNQVKTRSVPIQEKPYKRLIEIIKDQPIFNFTSTSGNLVGFRCPEFTNNISVPGYHLHFLNTNKDGGGHLLGFESFKLYIEIDFITDINIKFSSDKKFLTQELSSIQKEELHKIEKSPN